MGSGLWIRHPGASEVPGTQRIEICPPAIRRAPRWTDRLKDWLGQGWAAALPRPAATARARGDTPLSQVRAEFIASLGDVENRPAIDLCERIGAARSLRELWHLRAEIFSIVSCERDQAEARARLSRLNRHFPARAPRSGFGGFDA